MQLNSCLIKYTQFYTHNNASIYTKFLSAKLFHKRVIYLQNVSLENRNPVSKWTQTYGLSLLSSWRESDWRQIQEPKGNPLSPTVKGSQALTVSPPGPLI